MGWLIIPKLGESISWAIYDYPQKTRCETVDLKVVGRAMVHGIEGVEVVAVESRDKEFDAVNSEERSAAPLLCSSPKPIAGFCLNPIM